MRARILLTAAALALTTAAPAAHAFDLTGHWIGKWSCKGFDGTKFTSKEPDSTLDVTQTGNDILASIDGQIFLYNGTAIPDLAKPEKGEAVLLQCGTSNAVTLQESEIVRATVKTKDTTFKASFKATSIFTDLFVNDNQEQVPEVGTCKYSYKRIDTIDPQVPGCPQ